jgi:hypothetical protein
MLEPHRLKEEIESMKMELNRLIDADTGFNKVYEASVKLDKLIVRYQNECYRCRL